VSVGLGVEVGGAVATAVGVKDGTGDGGSSLEGWLDETNGPHASLMTNAAPSAAAERSS